MKVIAFFESIIIALSCFFGSIFNLPQKKVDEFTEQNGGFIYGVCHPNEDYELLGDAGLKWVRFDIPYPVNAVGAVSGYYTEFKERCREYTERGFKVMAVTPYPRDYFNIAGYNPIEDVERTKEMAVFLYNDLKDITSAFQITNEMGKGSSFMLPLTLEEASKFIGIQLEAINEAKEKDGSNFPIGYNSAYLQKDLQKLMKPYLQYCDYVGIDLYFGVQGKAKPSDYSKEVKKLYRMTHKPIIIEEFGFWSDGRPKTDAEKAEILGYYGYTTEAEAIADGMDFVNKLPPQFRERLKEEYPDSEEQWSEIIFSKMSNHFYGQASATTIENIPHTPEGQAEYFKIVMAELRKTRCLAGMIIYCCEDMGTCWYCGQSWCPFETKWGICDIEGNPKPAYYAVKDFIAENK